MCGARTPPAAAEPRAKLSRAGLAWALTGIVVQHLLRASDSSGRAGSAAASLGFDSKTRASAHEILIASPAVAALVRDANYDGLESAMTSGGSMQTLDHALERLVNAGTVTAEAALSRAVDKEAFARAVGKAGFFERPA